MIINVIDSFIIDKIYGFYHRSLYLFCEDLYWRFYCYCFITDMFWVFTKHMHVPVINMMCRYVFTMK